MRSIVIVLLMGVTFNVIADTYPAQVVGQQTALEYCEARRTTYFPGPDYWCANPQQIGSSFSIEVWRKGTYGDSKVDTWYYNPTWSCPSGGTLSGQNCIDAPACPAGQTRNAITGVCEAPPVTCEYPEVWDALSAACHVPECPASKVFNYLTLECATPPACSSYEEFINSPDKFACQTSSITCPGHSHANSTMDGCLPDKPLTCPEGQHDDGTYHCVSDDPHACGSDEMHGYVNGKPVCAKKTKTDQSSADLDTAYAARRAAQAANSAAKASKAAADAAAAADPSQSNQDAAAAAAVMAANAAQAAVDAATAENTARDHSDSSALRSIAENTQLINERAESRSASASDTCGTPPACTGDAIDCAVLQQLHVNNCKGLDAIAPGDVPAAEAITLTDAPGVDTLSYVTVNGDCPAPATMFVAGRAMEISYQYLCDYAVGIKSIVLLCCSLAAGMILLSSKSA